MHVFLDVLDLHGGISCQCFQSNHNNFLIKDDGMWHISKLFGNYKQMEVIFLTLSQCDWQLKEKPRGGAVLTLAE